MKKTIFTLGVLAVLVSYGVSRAEDAATSAGPCKADIEKFCASVEQGHGRKHKCLREHKDEASVECRTHMELKKQQWDAMKTACESDRDAYCKDKKGKDLHLCMKENKDKFSQACKDAKTAMRPAK